MEYIYYFSLIISALFGLCFGSFLNVLIYRLPGDESIVFPGSHCTSCGAPIKYRDNIPVLGYFLLRGKCRSCATHISAIYPIIEIITSVIVMGLFFVHGAFTLHFAADVVCALILLVAAVIDARLMIIPNRLTYPGLVIAALFSLRWGMKGLLRGLLGSAAGIAVLIVMYVLGRLIYKRESVGFGDFKLVLVTGFFLGPVLNFMTLIIAIVAGGLWGIVQIVSGKKKMGQEVPFGPFISLGGFVVLFFKNQVFLLIEKYLSLF